MRTADFPEFKKQFGMLCETYDRKRTQDLDDAYWKALELMSLADFKRASDLAMQRAGTDGYERMPKPGKLWQLRDDSRQRPQAPEKHEQQPEYSAVHRHAQRCMTAFLWEKGGASEAALLDMIEAKQRIVADFKLIATEDQITGGEIKAALFKAWKPLWKPMPEAEQRRHCDHLQRFGFTANFTEATQRRLAQIQQRSGAAA